MPLMPNEKSSSRRLLEALLLGVGADAVDQLLGVRGGSAGSFEPLQLAVHADLRRRVGGDVQIGCRPWSTCLQQSRQIRPFKQGRFHCHPAGCLPPHGGHASAPPGHFVTVRTARTRRDALLHGLAHDSSIEVTPSRTLHRPLSRSVNIPSSRALRRSSMAEAPVRISSRSSSLTSMTS